MNKSNQFNGLKLNLFDKSNGFGENKPVALELLDRLINILDYNNIDYFLISGTLLGYVRHNDFIPWDDDIDIIVSDDFIKKYDNIIEKLNIKQTDKNYISNIMFNTITSNHFYKFYFTNKVICPPKKNYNWPFIDLFVYRTTDKQINFFNKNWDKSQFFPVKKTLFNNINVSIPSNPEYFLKLNYGPNYMDLYISSGWNHREEKSNGRKRSCLTREIYENIFENNDKNKNDQDN